MRQGAICGRAAPHLAASMRAMLAVALPHVTVDNLNGETRVNGKAIEEVA